MTQNKRIILNIVATYGRSLFSLVCGLLTGRWVLMAMGEVDYGLRGVVGGLTFFVSFIISILAGSMGRFYAVAIGNAQGGGETELEECRAWFSTAVVIHTVLPTVLLIIGYPIGEWMVRHYLTIPTDRINACVWVWRWTCLNFWFSFTSTPFTSLYTARQEIAELTIYNLVQTSLTVCFCWYMVQHPGDWLATYMFWIVMLGAFPQVFIVIRAALTFPECKFRVKYLRSFDRIKQLFGFAGWQTFGAFGSILRGQAITILINKFFGPSVNAASSVGGTVSAQSDQLSSSMVGAFSPAIMNAWGRGDREYAIRMAHRVNRIGTLLLMVFALPMMIEADNLINLWLKTPPQYSAGLCISVLATALVDRTTTGQQIIVNANGKVAMYQMMLSIPVYLTLPLAWLVAALGWGVYAVAIVSTICWAGCAWGRVFFAQLYTGMLIRDWLFKTMIPLVVIGTICMILGVLVRLVLPPTFIRLFVTGTVMFASMALTSWKFVLDDEERVYVVARIQRILGKFKEV